MAQNGVIKFYRGVNGAVLPSKKDGTIFIVQSDPSNENGIDYYGDMYVDIDDATRLHIKPNDAIYYMSKAEWQNSTEIAVPGRVYCIYDYEQIQYTAPGKGTITGNKPAIIVGDGGNNVGSAYISDLPVFQTISLDEKDEWNNKVAAYAQLINFENNSASDGNDFDLHFTWDDIGRKDNNIVRRG